MADTIPMDRLSLLPEQEQEDSGQLMKYLEENCNMPTKGWWFTVDTAFQRLRKVLEVRPEESPDEENDPQSISAQTARADALPLVSLLPSGSHALGLTATNEDLQCVAFGTISTELYIEIFWEAVEIAQDEGSKFEVHKIESGAFWFNFEDHNFHLLYIHCEDLVRSSPGILNASGEVLRASDDVTQKVVEGIKRDAKRRASFRKRYQKVSYYYLRAWTIARGRYTPNSRLASARTLSFQELIKIINPQMLLDNPEFSLSHKISDILWNLNEKVLTLPPYPQPLGRIDPDRGPAELSRVLQEVEAASVHSKFQMPLYIQVNLIYWGGSEMACGKWLSMVEHRLSKLKERLESTNPRPDEVYLYPHRLLDLERDNRDSEGGYWAGCYILGVRRLIESPLDRRVAKTWNLQTVADTVIPKDDCSIKTVYMTANEFNDKTLIICPRNWPRPELMVDREQSNLAKQNDRPDQCKKGSKHQKNREQTSSEEAAIRQHPKGLRTARAVLSRLRHDPSFNIDEYKVGYEDRHTDVIQEKPVTAWVRETTDDLFIPEHRIRWFKRCPANGGEVLVWDKVLKIDRIFIRREVIMEGTV